MSSPYLPVAVALCVAAGMAVLFLLLARIGPRAATADKGIPYECGSDPVGSPRVRFSVRFYTVALLFLVFDLEIAFLYPWAVLFRELSCAGPLTDGRCAAGASWFGLVEMAVFVGVLLVALAYAWRRRVIGWD